MEAAILNIDQLELLESGKCRQTSEGEVISFFRDVARRRPALEPDWPSSSSSESGFALVFFEGHSGSSYSFVARAYRRGGP